MAVDLFTECLRWAVGIIVGLLFMIIFSAILWTALMHWKHKREMAWDVWEVSSPPVEVDDMYPRTHVSVPDRIPEEWNEAWW